MVSAAVDRTPVSVGPSPIVPEVAETIRRNDGVLVGLGEAEVIVWQRHNGEGFDEWLAAEPQARWVQLPSAGIDWLFDEGHYGSGITWTCAKGAFGDVVAELALGLLISGFRSIGPYSRADRWLPEEGRTLTGSQVAIVGAGGIVTALLERLRPFRAETWASVGASSQSPSPIMSSPSTIWSKCCPWQMQWCLRCLSPMGREE